MTMTNTTLQTMKTIEEISVCLQELFVEFNAKESGSEFDRCIQNMSLDSRQIQDSDLFVAIQGEQRHGLDFIESVLDKTPGLVISDRPLNSKEQEIVSKSQSKCSFFVVEDIASRLGDFAAWFYGHPSRALKVVGITGTNGKTSTAFYTAQLLNQLGQKVALIGTLGNGALDNLQPTMNTTPDSVQVQRLLNQFAKQGMHWVIMEVSSHALCLGRIQGVSFETVALTQVTRDHMDFHGSVKAYQEAKTRLFYEYEARHKVVNLADNVGQEINNQLSHSNTESALWGYTPNTLRGNTSHATGHQLPNLQCTKFKLNSEGIICSFVINDDKHESISAKDIAIPLMGQFNLENILCALSILLVSNSQWKVLKPGLLTLNSVLGRMQVLAQSPTIILDFAHTPDALEQVLKAVKAHLTLNDGKLIIVFGCGGNRDKGKRPLMGEIAESLADKVVVTNDNPRDELPEQIVLDIVKGFKHPKQASSVLDRAQAITEVLEAAVPKDMIVIAGKGHEDYQEIKGVKTPYSDIQVVNEWLEKHNNTSRS